MSESMPDAVLFADLPSPEYEQFRASRLSVWDWGTFSRLHRIELAWRGHMLLGPSGAGKSTLQDAMSAMLVPPQKVRFNAAAEEGERGGRDRTLMSYVRGAWADRGEEGSSETAKQFLRPDATWSAIALEYRNLAGRVLTLVRVLWTRGAGTTTNLNKHFMVVEGEFDLAELKDFDGERRTLRHAISRPDIRHHDDSFASYQEHWCRIFGIHDASVLELLHKTQSTKSLGDLNTFLRDFMLAEPETFEKAQLLVDEFIDLEQSHRAVVTARRQIEVLAPACEAHAEHHQAEVAIVENDALTAALPAFQHSLNTGLLEAEHAMLVRERATAAAERDALSEQIGASEETVEQLEHQRREQGGGSIEEQERRIAELAEERSRRSRTRERVRIATHALRWGLADNAADFAGQVTDAQALVQGAAQRMTEQAATVGKLAIALHEATREFAGLREEIDSLERNPSSIPSKQLQLRNRLCEALNLPTSKVVFVGELLQVREEERAAWGPAAEALLRSFALDLLIDDADDRKVARWVDETNLRGRIVYRPVRSGQQHSTREPQGLNSIFHKLEARPGHPFGPWVRRELAERFDYTCVSSPAELARDEKRITAQGQIRHAGRRTVKDDTLNLQDRGNWVLGFDNREKLARVREKAQAKGAELSALQEQQKDLERNRQQDLLRTQNAQVIAAASWNTIDDASVAQRIGQLQDHIQQLRVGNPELTQIDARLAEARQRKRQQDRAHA